MTQKVFTKLLSFAGGDKLGLLKIAIASSCLIIVPQVQVKAASITVLNPSFEFPTATSPDGLGFYSINDITNWVIGVVPGQDAGVSNPGASLPPSIYYNGAPVPDGVQVAYSNGATISQVLSAVLQPNTQYTLGAHVGQRLAIGFQGYDIQLWAGNTLLASNYNPTPVAGTFVPVTVNYTSGSSGPIGEQLEIRLLSSGVQANFDKITLNASPIPEPSAILGLLGFGLLGLVSTLQQKR
ncbi:MAG: PEP-CTERM sorting domain-containing protein [Microcystis aeruginosa K13-06]|nr:PEP-CTERM sorting domain-containing protein [Microcystis aeruginosa K13-06]